MASILGCCGGQMGVKQPGRSVPIPRPRERRLLRMERAGYTTGVQGQGQLAMGDLGLPPGGMGRACRQGSRYLR